MSRYLAVLEKYFGAELTVRRGIGIELTEFGRLFVETITEPMDAVTFTAERMRRKDKSETQHIVVSTSLSTFAYTLLIPNLRDFSDEMGGVTVDVISTRSAPTSSDNFDVFLTRDLTVREPADRWDFYNEQIVCVGAPDVIAGRGLEALHSTPVVTVTSRPDILPTWLRAMGLKISDITLGARYDHNYLALPAATTGQCLLVTPHIVVADLIKQGLLEVQPGSRAPTGMQYSAYAADQSDNPELTRVFCRWLTKLCKRATLEEVA